MQDGTVAGRLVIVVPLKEGAHERALELLSEGPPFDLEEAAVVRHEVHATRREVVFVFELQSGKGLHLLGEDPGLWKAAAAWREVMDGRPRKAQTVYAWERGGPEHP